jgi:2-haloacid dehalogenase
MEEVRAGRRPWTVLDVLHRESLDELLPMFGLEALSDEERRGLVEAWHRLDPWPDTVPGLLRLKPQHILSPLSNGNVALLTTMAKHAGLPWDLILSAETSRAYKPRPEAYLNAVAMLALAPPDVMMVAAHNDDLQAAQGAGLRTAFIPRILEHGPGQEIDLGPEGDWDVIAADFEDLATRLKA